MSRVGKTLVMDIKKCGGKSNGSGENIKQPRTLLELKWYSFDLNLEMKYDIPTLYKSSAIPWLGR
jgi:hypothetical protein